MASSYIFLQNRLDCAQWKIQKTGRRYSQALLGMACMWNSSSSSLYKQILNKGVLTLPSIRTINRSVLLLMLILDLTNQLLDISINTDEVYT